MKKYQIISFQPACLCSFITVKAKTFEKKSVFPLLSMLCKLYKFVFMIPSYFSFLPICGQNIDYRYIYIDLHFCTHYPSGYYGFRRKLNIICIFMFSLQIAPYALGKWNFSFENIEHRTCHCEMDIALSDLA